MIASPPLPLSDAPDGWGITLDQASEGHFSALGHVLVTVPGFLAAPENAIAEAVLQDFAKITPQYPGVRAALDPAVCAAWLTALAPLLEALGDAAAGEFGILGHGRYPPARRQPRPALHE